MGNSNSLIILLFSLFIIIGGDTGYTQMPPQDVPPATPTNEPAPQPEVPKKVSTIIVDNDRLSVEFVNVNFGEIIQAVGQKAGFMIEGSSTTFSKNVTTKFNDLEIDTGIMRLFSFAKESNYRIDYDTKGKMSKLKIYGISAARNIPQTLGTGAPSGTPQTPAISRLRLRLSGTPPESAIPPPPPVGFRPISLPPKVPQVSEVPQPATPDQVPEGQNSANEPVPNEDVKEIPYIPPQKKPVYIPPITR
jgi:hypothetical protein